MTEKLRRTLTGRKEEGPPLPEVLRQEGLKIDVAIAAAASRIGQISETDPAARMHASEDILRNMGAGVATATLRLTLRAMHNVWTNPAHTELPLRQFLEEVSALTQSELNRHFGEHPVGDDAGEE